jgi:hypothetical protein
MSVPILLTQDQWMGALCLWREARGCTHESRLGVYWVLLNRVRDPRRRWPGNLTDVVLEPKQFSSFNVGDPNSVKFPNSTDVAFEACCEIAQSPGVSDPTIGATNYHSIPEGKPLPAWADPAKLTITIGPFKFYRL